MGGTLEDENVVARFWRGIDSHDWDLVSSSIADDFERHGMLGVDAVICVGKSSYLAFVSQVIGRMDHHDLKARSTFWSADGRRAVSECIETIRPPGEDDLVMHFINIIDVNEQGLMQRLDIYWKTPPRMPPSWITPEAILSDAK